MESITKFAKNNKNASSPSKTVVTQKKSKKVIPDPIARPVKNTTSEENQPLKEEKKEVIKEQEEGYDK